MKDIWIKCTIPQSVGESTHGKIGPFAGENPATQPVAIKVSGSNLSVLRNDGKGNAVTLMELSNDSVARVCQRNATESKRRLDVVLNSAGVGASFAAPILGLLWFVASGGSWGRFLDKTGISIVLLWIVGVGLLCALGGFVFGLVNSSDEKKLSRPVFEFELIDSSDQCLLTFRVEQEAIDEAQEFINAAGWKNRKNEEK